MKALVFLSLLFAVSCATATKDGDDRGERNSNQETPQAIRYMLNK